MALTLTKAGKSLLQKIQVGEIEVIDFTGIAVGNGRWNTEDINDNISSLKEMKIKNGLSNKQTEVRDNETIVTISATLNNKEIEEAFYVYEVGLYAMDGDEEVLYAFDITPSNEIAQAVVQANTVPQYIPVILDTALSSIDKVNIKITADVGFVSADQFENYKQDIKRQLDRKQPAGDYATTEVLTSGLSNKSDKNHNHDGTYLKKTDASSTYLNKTDAGNTYATKEALNTGLAGKAASNHTHSNYASSNHNHDSVYSKVSHTHTGYAASGHNHDTVYSRTNHSHGGYALSSHNHDFEYTRIGTAAPKPITQSGIGQIYTQYYSDTSEYWSSSTLTIPSGGTWVYWYVHGMDGLKGGIVAGGQQFKVSSLSQGLVAYRIA